MLLVKLGNNTLFVTLRERAELTNEDILIELTFRDTKTDPKILLTSDTSLSTKRVNELPLEIVATSGEEDLANAKVHLLSGDYQYRIFESTGGSLDIAGKKLLEIGVLNFNLDKTKIEYTQDKNKTVYNG